MGDRNNLIKFGPEWLRNLSREGNTSNLPGNNHNSSVSQSPNNPGGSGNSPSTSGAAGSSNTSNAPPNISPKVQLAKLRYGREEILALYETASAEAPPELKTFDSLHQSRGKRPFALNNTYEDKMRANTRGGPAMGGMLPGERFRMGRGMGRGLSVSDGRGRPRVPFVRQTPIGRGNTSWHLGSSRMPGYSGGADDDSSLNLRSSWNASNGGSTSNRTSNDQQEWPPSRMFRSKRQGQATNWRQSREEGEEWRSTESGRANRNNQQEKWERDWGDRPSQDKPQPWSSSRRTWVGGDTQNNDDNLPEWAMDGAEACGGTFDSSGAFHGYSNDDSNLPKSQESPYSLTRSHTHDNLVRPKHFEEGSEEWWASEKAKKLSPKRFDASEVKFKKQMSAPEMPTDSETDPKATTSKEDYNLYDIPEKSSAENLQKGGNVEDDKFKNKNTFPPKFSEKKAFESLLRSDVNKDESNEDRGNFQSVMITPNNSLRQKHQNIVSAASEVPRETNINRDQGIAQGQGILQMLHNPPSTSQQANDKDQNKHHLPEDKIVEDIFNMTLEEKDILTNASQPGLSSPSFSNQSMMNRKQTPGLQSGIPSSLQTNMQSGMQLPGLQMGGLPPTLQHVAGMQQLSMQGNMQQSSLQGTLQGSTLQSGNTQQQSLQSLGIQRSSMQSSPGLQQTAIQNSMQSSMMHGAMQGNMQPLQSAGMTALNSRGLPMGAVNNAIGMPFQSVNAPVMQMNPGINPGISPILNSGMNAGMNPGMTPGMNPGMGGPGLQGAIGGSGMQPLFPTGGNIPVMPNANVGNSSLFMGQNPSSPSVGTSGDIPMPNHGAQSNMFPLHGLQPSASQAAFNSSIYGNMMQQPPPALPTNPQNYVEKWYYEDPEKNIQGPFSSKEMYNWYRAGFFNPNLMVRRACDALMRPLGSYGPVPFAQPEMRSFPLSSGFERSTGPHESMLNSQQALGLDSVMNMPNFNEAPPPMNSLQFGSVGLIRNHSFPQQQPMVDSLWSQPSTSADLLWMQQAINSRNEARANNQQPMFFWDQQPSAISSNALLPEDITKEMKTEYEILAQLRASQNINTSQNIPYMNEQPCNTTSNNPEEEFASTSRATPNLDELQKLIQKDTLAADTDSDKINEQTKIEKPSKVSQSSEPKAPQTKTVTESKPTKQTINENEKAKTKESNVVKTKSKKKEDKKEEIETKTRDDENTKAEKRSQEPSPTKSKKEDKLNKKDSDKEKKEWLKDGFTIVKGSDKNVGKDNKKKAEEAKIAEEVERKRKEEERLAAEDERKRKHAEIMKKQQELQQQQQHQQQQRSAESAVKKAPWSVSNQALAATSKEGLTLAEIQRLEREKKLEQIKEQQQMVQIIAQQQAAALARDQEMQAGLGWAKKKGAQLFPPEQSLAEIQAEARKQAVAATTAAAAAAAEALVSKALEEGAPPPTVHAPWANAPNGVQKLAGGFWDTQPNQPGKSEKAQESPKTSEPKGKKKVAVSIQPKKETSPEAEFENWCATVLASWSTKIDVPTFVGFLKDIGSPYEVKDYVKCYLGESKDSGDFARQFLERRSKLLRVGMVTPSDDLCSPAVAVNPRTNSGSDYQEGKGKKIKKNKMLKVDARILGFSVTAAEDRINVGDIDSV